MISNFSRNATIADSEFVWVGESAIVSVGSTEKIDGTKGDQPRGNQILRNLIHEVGIFGKQTAGYVQAMSCQTTLKNNVMFNGPRAGINFLDGFGGGNLVQSNALWNWVRETGDQCAPPSQMRSNKAVPPTVDYSHLARSLLWCSLVVSSLGLTGTVFQKPDRCLCRAVGRSTVGIGRHT